MRERERGKGHNGMVIIVVVAPDDEKKAVERGALAIDANGKASGLMYGNLQNYCGPTGTNENVMWVPPCRLQATSIEVLIEAIRLEKAKKGRKKGKVVAPGGNYSGLYD